MINKLTLAFIFSTSLGCAIDPNFIKGSELLMCPDKIDLAPVNAATMLETGWLENLRLLWNVGLKDGIERYSQITAEVDYPHTQTALLLQYLFPSPDGAALALNNRAFFALKGLTFSELGQTYALADKGTSLDKYIRSKLEKNRRAEGGRLATVMLTAFEEDTTQFIPNLARHCFIAYVLKTAQSKEQIWDFLVAANLLNAPTDEKRQQYLSDNFSPSLYGEFKASLDCDSISPDEQQGRTAYLDAFLSWKQRQMDAGTRTYITNDGQRILKVPSVEVLLQSETAWQKFRPSSQTMELLGTNKETAYFLGHTYARTEKDTFIVEYGMSSWQEGTQRFNFSDCAEAALFSTLNGLLFDQNTRRPNVNNLPETATPELKKLYTTITESANPLASFRPQFSHLISNIDGLDYVKTSPSGSKYELVSTIDNLKQALIYLLGLHTDIEDKNLFSVFSSDTTTFEVSATSTDTLDILRNDTPWLTLKSSNNHTELKSHKPDIEWGHQISRHLLGDRYEKGDSVLSFIYPALFESKYTWRILTSAEDSTPSNAQILTTALGLTLNGTKYRTKLLYDSLSDRPHTQEALSSLTGISAKASLDDPYTAADVLRLLASIGHERVKSTALSRNLCTLFIQRCQKSPIYAWAGFLFWRDYDLKPYLNHPLTHPTPKDLLEPILHAKIFMELFAGTPNKTDDIVPNRFIPKLEKPGDLQQQFLSLYQNLFQQNQDYKTNITPHIILHILDEICDNFDSDALKEILRFSKVNGILMLFNWIHEHLLRCPEIKDEIVDLMLDSIAIPNFSAGDDGSCLQIFVTSTHSTKHEIILKVLDKILRERPEFLSTQIKTLNYTVLDGLLKSYDNNFYYQVFTRVKTHFPGFFITKRIWELYTSHRSAHWDEKEQKSVYTFTLADDQRSEIRQFIIKHKDEFKALYVNKENTPNFIREILY